MISIPWGNIIYKKICLSRKIKTIATYFSQYVKSPEIKSSLRSHYMICHAENTDLSSTPVLSWHYLH